MPVPKSGDMITADNYRDISDISIVAEAYGGMIFNRIRPVLDTPLRQNQNGFSRGEYSRCTRLLEGIKTKNMQPHLQAAIS